MMACSPAHGRSVRRPVVLLVLLLPMVLIGLLATPAQAEELVTFPAGSSVNLPPSDDNTVTLVVPVAPADDIDLSTGGSATLLQVRRGSEVVELEPEDVDVDLVAQPPGLSIVVRPAAFAARANYILGIQLDVGAATQFVAVTVVRPASTVDIVQAPITVERTVLVPEFGWDWNPSFAGDVLNDVDKPELNLRVGAEGRVHELSINDITGKAPRIDVELRCSDGEDTCDFEDLAPNALIDLEYELVDDFPLGTETHTIEVRSPQLASPVEFSVIVETKRTPVLLALLLVLGILLGFLVRHALARLRDAGEVRVQRDELIKRLVALNRLNPDEDLSNKLEAHVERLERASAWRVDKTKGEIEDVASEAKADLDKHAAAVTALKKRVDELRTLSIARPLSKVVAGKLDAARSRYQLAVSLLSTNDVGKGEPEVEALETEARAARSDVVDWLGDYQGTASALAASVKEKKQLITDNVARAAFESLEDATADGATAATLDDKPDGADPNLGDVLDAAADTSARHLDLEESATQLAGYVGRQGLGTEAADIMSALRVPDEVHVVRRLRAPVVAAADALTTPKGPGASARSAPPGSAAPKPPSDQEKRATVTLADLPYAPDTWLDGVPLLGGAFAYGVAGTVAKAVRFVILTIMVLLVGYATWQGDWTGTATDIVGVLAAGFAAEISTDAVTTAATGLTKRT